MGAGLGKNFKRMFLTKESFVFEQVKSLFDEIGIPYCVNNDELWVDGNLQILREKYSQNAGFAGLDLVSYLKKIYCKE